MFTFVAEVRNDGSVDLHASCQALGHDVGRQPVGLGAGPNSGPRDKHGESVCLAGTPGKPGNSRLTTPPTGCVLTGFQHANRPAMRDDYIRDALKSIPDPNVLINVISRRVKQLKRGNRPLVESLEKLSPEDTALREVIEGKISHELATS